MTIRRTLRLARASGLNPAATLVGGAAVFALVGLALAGLAIAFDPAASVSDPQETASNTAAVDARGSNGGGL